MTDLLVAGLIVLFFPAIVVAVFVFWSCVGSWVDYLCEWVSPPPAPHCDVDPLCHPGFRWREDGIGEIYGIRVATRERGIKMK